MKLVRAIAILVAFGAAAIACDRIVVLSPAPDDAGQLPFDGAFVPDAAQFDAHPDGG